MSQVLKRVAYNTTPMQAARQGDRLDLSREPRRSLSANDPALAEFLRTAPAPDRREWGNPEVSAAEDAAFLHDLAQWRREATDDLK